MACHPDAIEEIRGACGLNRCDGCRGLRWSGLRGVNKSLSTGAYDGCESGNTQQKAFYHWMSRRRSEYLKACDHKLST